MARVLSSLTAVFVKATVASYGLFPAAPRLPGQHRRSTPTTSNLCVDDAVETQSNPSTMGSPEPDGPFPFCPQLKLINRRIPSWLTKVAEAAVRASLRC